jgi:hypothetical protein
MFGISFESKNNDSDEDLLKFINTISDRFYNKNTKEKTIFVIIFFAVIVITPIIFLCLFGLASSFLWNNSFANIFGLPTLEWFNFVFGYLFVYFIYKMLKVMW